MNHLRSLTSAAVAALSMSLPSTSGNPIERTSLGYWQGLGPIPVHPRQEHTTVALNETTFAIIGGIIPATDGDGSNSPDNWETTNMMQLYNTVTKEWKLGPSLPLAVNHANTVVVDGKLFLLGGLAPSADGNWVKTGQSYVLDSDGAWTALRSTPEQVSRGSAAVGANRGLIYLAGGMTQLIPQGTVDTVIAYNVSSNQWITGLPELPAPRDHAGSAVVDGTLYVVGGREMGQNNTRNTVFALDLDNVHAGWTTMAGRMPTARGGVAAAAIGHKIYTFGGEGSQVVGSNGIFPQTEVYDVVADSWEKLQSMEVPRHGGWAVAIGKGVYLPGGGIVQGGAAVDTFDVFWPPVKCN